MTMNFDLFISVITALFALLVSQVHSASLQQVTVNFGDNPTNVGFYIYVPDVLPSKPAILVNPHWCHGSAADAYAGSQFATLASQHGYIVIYPDSPNTADSCWDVSSAQTLAHNGGGDSLGIVNMVKWTIGQYGADASRVFVTGVSSGAMMTNVLIGAYPDIFAAGSAFAGVAFGCFAAPGNNTSVYDYWNSDCATGLVTHTGQEWASIVRAGYPGYTGWRPKMQVFHGTADEVLNYTNFGEEVKEWTAVLGLSAVPSTTSLDTPLAGWTKYVYGSSDWFEAYSAAGVTHNIPVQESNVVSFFDLDCTSSCFSWGQDGSPNGSSSSTTTLPTSNSTPRSTTTSTTVPTSTSFTTATSTSQTGAPLYGQCGGIGYTGATSCLQGTCTTYNSWYFQCVPTGV